MPEQILESIPNRKIDQQLAGDLDCMIADAERFPVGSPDFQKLLAYRQQCCGHGIHRFGEWKKGNFVPRGIYEPGLRATEERRTCVYCSRVEARPIFEPAPPPSDT